MAIIVRYIYTHCRNLARLDLIRARYFWESIQILGFSSILDIFLVCLKHFSRLKQTIVHVLTFKNSDQLDWCIFPTSVSEIFLEREVEKAGQFDWGKHQRCRTTLSSYFYGIIHKICLPFNDLSHKLDILTIANLQWFACPTMIYPIGINGCFNNSQPYWCKFKKVLGVQIC